MFQIGTEVKNGTEIAEIIKSSTPGELANMSADALRAMLQLGVLLLRKSFYDLILQISVVPDYLN